jgi:hypothetical protein
MSEALRTAGISAASGIVGVVVGALVSGFFAYKISQVQLQQAMMSTAASSALSVRSTLAEKASAFFLANQSFLAEIQNEKLDVAKARSAAEELNKARSNLSPYLDADLLIACEDVADNVRVMVSNVDSEERTKAFHAYTTAYKSFVTLYLRLRRSLEASAQLNVVSSQIADQYKTQ